MEGEEKQRLTGSEEAEVKALQGLVDSGKLRPGSAGWDRWLFLVQVRETGQREASPAVVNEASPGSGERSFQEWGAFYFPGRSKPAQIKAIDRLRSAGKAQGLIPPLTEPAAMPAWFEAMRQRGKFPQGCPDEFRRAAASVNQASPVLAGAAPAPQASPVDSSPVSDDEKDPGQVLRRLEDDAARLYRDYEAAQAAGQAPESLDVHRRRWNTAQDAAAAQKKRMSDHGDLVPRPEAVAAVGRFVHSFPPILLRELIKALPSIPAEVLRGGIQRAWSPAAQSLTEALTA